MKPVVLLSYANDQDAYLSNLKDEEIGIRNALSKAHDEGFIEVQNLGATTHQAIYQDFNRFHKRIHIFHYGGHANSSSLRLDDQDADAEGLATLIAQEKHLKLVFLNGCATKEQVKKLLELGVKVVIATSVSIRDKTATKFAIQFYEALASHKSIQIAFETATSYLKSSNQNNSRDMEVRFKSLHEGIDDLQDSPWNLYYTDPSTIKWKLPNISQRVFSDPWVGRVIESEDVNKHLILPLIEAMAEYSREVKKALQNYEEIRDMDEDDDEYDNIDLDTEIRKLMDEVIKNFPMIIGVQIRTLFSPEMSQKIPPRLLQMIEVYLRLIKFLSYVSVCQLWDERNRPDSSLEIPEAYLNSLNHFLSQEQNPNFDYLQLLEQTCGLFAQHHIPFFLEELEDFFKALDSSEDDFFKACQYLESIRQELLDRSIDFNQISELCDKVEYSLSLVLQKAAFLAKYKVISVKDINIFKIRRTDPLFKHQIGILAGISMDVAVNRPRDYSNYTDSHSVIIVKGIRKVDTFLNLMPFVIDGNAFNKERKSNLPKIFLYDYNQDFDCFYYSHIEEKGMQLSVKEAPYERVKEQFECLKEDFKLNFNK